MKKEINAHSLRKQLNRAKLFVAVILLQFGYAGMTILAKFALNQGMSHYTFAVYRNLIATLTIAPFALFFERKGRPKMTFSTFGKIILLGLLEPVMDQNLFYTGMKYTTATFTSAMCNILPALTFLMAWILRLEKVNIRRLHSQAKVVGTVVTVGGAMLMTMITGPAIGLPWTKGKSHHESVSAVVQQDHVKGSIMIAIGCFSWASFVILQAMTLKSYPAELSLAALICTAGAVEGTIVTMIMEWGNASIWAIHMDTKFLAALYGGIICSGVGYYIQGVILKERGPVFVTAFSPLSMVIVAIMGSFVLAEQMYLGRIIGAIVIVTGLYLVVWGKSKDQSPNSSDQIAPVEPMATIETSMSTSSNGFIAIEVSKVAEIDESS